MEELLVEQRSTIRLITNAIKNFEKTATAKRTLAAVESRIKLLRERWERCRQLDVKITVAATAAKRTNDGYFEEDESTTAEEAFEEAHDNFHGKFASLQPHPIPSAHSTVLGHSSLQDGQADTLTGIKLPTIDLPHFSGCYTEWTNHKNMFDTIFIQRAGLNNRQRLNYLKSTLSGEAARLVQHFSLTEKNFQAAWETLIDTYEDHRAIIDVHFQSFLSLPAIKSESAKDLKNLRDRTRESLRALQNLGCPSDSWNPIIVYLTVQKLDAGSAREWEMQLGATSTYPSFQSLVDFQSSRIRALERTQGSKSDNRSNSKPKSSPSTTERREIAKDKECCYNCLRQGHRPRSCPSKYSCTFCKKKHNTLLHPDTITEPSNSSRPANTKLATETLPTTTTEPSVSTHHAQNSPRKGQYTLLATAVINVRTASGRSLRLRALLDQGSQATLIKESFVKQLRPKLFPVNAIVNGVGEVEIGIAKHRLNVHVEPCNRAGDSVAISALVLPTLTRYAPRSHTKVHSWQYLSGLELADPQPNSEEPIDLIIGADYYGTLLRPGLRQGPIGAPTAQATLFGWILSGPVSVINDHPDTIAAHNCSTSGDLHNALARFWEIEELPSIKELSDDERRCEDQFVVTHRREQDGRYIVRLPFKKGPPLQIGESLFRARSMLNTVHRRHMRATTMPACNEAISQCVYLPHHPVVRESSSTTRVRVVFNASSQTSNSTLLNDHLLVGPKLQTDITTIITWWRAHRYAYTADIAKMFQQIQVDPRDIDYQRILWRRGPDKETTPFQLLTVTYGTASAPFLANRVLHQLANDEGHNFPAAASILKQNFYVDDALFGADSIESAIEMRKELNQLLSRGSFQLRKWAANTEELLPDCQREHHELASDVPFKELESIDILGIAWNPNRDKFQFRFTPVESPQFTKRVILSIIARLFDPLGCASPIVITAKIILQELWFRKIDWDTELPDDLATTWQTYYGQLAQIQGASVPRWTGQSPEHAAVEIHSFADASTRAYAAVIYLRVLRDLDDAQVTLLIAKIIVSPVKAISVPCLELCAAVLLARTLRKVVEDLSLADTPAYCWSDSAVTLHWLNKHASNWQTFVANRVREIHETVPKAIWRHVPTKENPADCASRGLLPSVTVDHMLWWNGPLWLERHSTFWPSNRIHPCNFADLEAKKPFLVHAVQEKEEEPIWDLPQSISSWPRLLRVTSYCLRFIARARLASSQTNRVKPKLCQDPVRVTACEVRSARDLWIRLVQGSSFGGEISSLREGKAVANSSSLRRLNPFIDKAGFLRVGGRLANAPISYDEQHPIILPRHRISELIIRQTHARTLHGGPRLTLKILRQTFWILRDSTLVKQIVRGCVQWARERTARPAQLMGDLPPARVSPGSRAFLHTGVDYAGPLSVRLSEGRGHKSQNSYLALFICLATRAVHLELVSDYSTSGFLAAFRRFVARRGIPVAMYSDNGTNFVGADQELRNALRTVARDQDLRAQLISDGAEWHFNPPAAPHFRGLWEAGVKSVKHHLRRTIGAHTLTFEDLTTLLIQIEACLNSRPIAPLSNDPDDLTCLTPGHFLIGGALVAIPEPSVLDVNKNRLSRWLLVQRKVEHFWRRWAADFLHAAQQRNKWSSSEANLQVGDLVLLRSQLNPPTKWQLGRIITCHPGNDGLVRVVTVKTANSTLKRPINQLCVLPVRAAISEFK